MRKGEIAKQHYEYEKLGSCALLAAIEPLTGRRLGQVYAQRTKREFTLFCLSLATLYAEATKIRLVLDNLNTHNASSFYEHLEAEHGAPVVGLVRRARAGSAHARSAPRRSAAATKSTKSGCGRKGVEAEAGVA